MRRPKEVHPRDNYIIVTAIYPDRPGTFMEIQHRPLSTGEIVVSVPLPPDVDPPALRRAVYDFNVAGFHVGRAAQASFYSPLSSLIPDLGTHQATLFGSTAE